MFSIPSRILPELCVRQTDFPEIKGRKYSASVPYHCLAHEWWGEFMEWVRVSTRGRTNVKIVSRLQEVVRSDENISLESAIVPSFGRVLCNDLLHLGRGYWYHLW